MFTSEKSTVDPVITWVVGSLLSIGLAAGLNLFVSAGVALGAVAVLNIAFGILHLSEKGAYAMFTSSDDGE